MDESVVENKNYLDVCLGISQWQSENGEFFLEKDYRVKGEVWRVHLSDADPFPSTPHAHCVDGAKRFLGCTLHLGTRELYRKKEKLGRLLDQKQFDRLIEMIKPKFPKVELPLSSGNEI